MVDNYRNPSGSRKRGWGVFSRGTMNTVPAMLGLPAVEATLSCELSSNIFVEGGPPGVSMQSNALLNATLTGVQNTIDNGTYDSNNFLSLNPLSNAMGIIYGTTMPTADGPDYTVGMELNYLLLDLPPISFTKQTTLPSTGKSLPLSLQNATQHLAEELALAIETSFSNINRFCPNRNINLPDPVRFVVNPPLAPLTDDTYNPPEAIDDVVFSFSTPPGDQPLFRAEAEDAWQTRLTEPYFICGIAGMRQLFTCVNPSQFVTDEEDTPPSGITTFQWVSHARWLFDQDDYYNGGQCFQADLLSPNLGWMARGCDFFGLGERNLTYQSAQNADGTSTSSSNVFNPSTLIATERTSSMPFADIYSSAFGITPQFQNNYKTPRIDGFLYDYDVQSHIRRALTGSWDTTICTNAQAPSTDLNATSSPNNNKFFALRQNHYRLATMHMASRPCTVLSSRYFILQSRSRVMSQIIQPITNLNNLSIPPTMVAIMFCRSGDPQTNFPRDTTASFANLSGNALFFPSTVENNPTFSQQNLDLFITDQWGSEISAVPSWLSNIAIGPISQVTKESSPSSQVVWDSYQENFPTPLAPTWWTTASGSPFLSTQFPASLTCRNLFHANYALSPLFPAGFRAAWVYFLNQINRLLSRPDPNLNWYLPTASSLLSFARLIGFV
jgi:hypothetical protein